MKKQLTGFHTRSFHVLWECPWVSGLLLRHDQWIYDQWIHQITGHIIKLNLQLPTTPWRSGWLSWGSNANSLISHAVGLCSWKSVGATVKNKGRPITWEIPEVWRRPPKRKGQRAATFFRIQPHYQAPVILGWVAELPDKAPSPRELQVCLSGQNAPAKKLSSLPKNAFHAQKTPKFFLTWNSHLPSFEDLLADESINEFPLQEAGVQLIPPPVWQN